MDIRFYPGGNPICSNSNYMKTKWLWQIPKTFGSGVARRLPEVQMWNTAEPIIRNLATTCVCFPKHYEIPKRGKTSTNAAPQANGTNKRGKNDVSRLTSLSVKMMSSPWASVTLPPSFRSAVPRCRATSHNSNARGSCRTAPRERGTSTSSTRPV